jgi:ferredoxin
MQRQSKSKQSKSTVAKRTVAKTSKRQLKTRPTKSTKSTKPTAQSSTISQQQQRQLLAVAPQPATLSRTTVPQLQLDHATPLEVKTTYTPTRLFSSASLTTSSPSFTIPAVATTPARKINILRTTSITTQTNTATTQKPKLVIPSTRPFSSNHDDEDHDHGAYERKPPADPSQAMKITIIDREGTPNVVDCKVGDNILQLMRIFQERNPKLYLEGACESSLACSTCHIILDDASYNLLARVREATEEEEDMLDMASCLTPTSRLGCQINLVKEMDGATISLPKFSRNFYVDGHVPQPH